MSSTDSTLPTPAPSSAMTEVKTWQVPVALLLAVGVPVATYGWLLVNPQHNHQLIAPTEHFLVVTVVSLLALGVAVLVGRAALQIEHYRVLFISLGFVALAGFFSVHALATPGVMLGGVNSAYPEISSPSGTAVSVGDYSGSIVGLSAILSLFGAAALFALSYTPLAQSISHRFPFRGGGLLLAVIAILGTYAFLALAFPAMVAGVPFSEPPLLHVLAGASVVLLGFSSWRQGSIYAQTGLPSHGALVLSFLLLAQAQALMGLSEFWRLAWWGYHILMLAAVVLALGALFVELDRRRGLERFLPSEVVERVVSGDLLRLSGERRTVTVVFADLRGSTTMAEHMPAEAVVEVLNTYVGALAQCVFAQNGMLDKFLGDGLMAIFGVLKDPTDGAVPAARAALQMRQTVNALNAERVAEGGMPLQFGVALHSGEVVLGAIGIPRRSDFTAIGDTVNTAARLEGLCKEFGVDVVLSQQTAERLDSTDFPLKELGTTQVRGRQESVQVFTLT